MNFPDLAKSFGSDQIGIHNTAFETNKSSVADPDPEPDPEPDPDPEGSETFGRIRSGSEIIISNPDSNPDPKPDPKQISKKEIYIQAKIW